MARKRMSIGLDAPPAAPLELPVSCAPPAADGIAAADRFRRLCRKLKEERRGGETLTHLERRAVEAWITAGRVDGGAAIGSSRLAAMLTFVGYLGETPNRVEPRHVVAMATAGFTGADLRALGRLVVAAAFEAAFVDVLRHVEVHHHDG